MKHTERTIGYRVVCAAARQVVFCAAARTALTVAVRRVEQDGVANLASALQARTVGDGFRVSGKARGHCDNSGCHAHAAACRCKPGICFASRQLVQCKIQL